MLRFFYCRLRANLSIFCTAPSARGCHPISLLQLYVNIHIVEDIIVEHFIVPKFFSRGIGATDLSMLFTGLDAVIHCVSLPIRVACNSCVSKNIIVPHFTEPKFFKQA